MLLEADKTKDLLIDRFLVDTAKVIIVERSQVEIEHLIDMLRFENCEKLDELPGFQK